MRLFLALDVPGPIKSKLAGQVEPLKKDYPYFRWVSPENFHITLHFFGDYYQPEDLIKKISEATFDANEFYLYSLDLRIFLKERITVYLGFQRSKELERIVTNIKDTVGIKSDKKYEPHLTLARYKIPSKQQYLHLKKKLTSYDVDIEFKNTKLTLFNTVMETPKPLYEKVAEFPLIAK